MYVFSFDSLLSNQQTVVFHSTFRKWTNRMLGYKTSMVLTLWTPFDNENLPLPAQPTLGHSNGNKAL